MTQSCIALLGKRDVPTDAVEEYCRYLGAALIAHGFQVEIRRFPWERIGWSRAFAQIEKAKADWGDKTILVQYTALAWSTRGFPLKFSRVLKILKSSGARVVVVFHDVEPFPGSRAVDRLRRAVQVRTMRRALSLADSVIVTVPPENLSWISHPASKVTFIPVGPNLPFPMTETAVVPHTIPTIGVFSITGGKQGARETKLILAAVSYAAQMLGNLRLSIFGRHAELREGEIRQGLRNFPVEVSVSGVVEPHQVIQQLSACDLLLFVRGPISSRRSSAIAAIACGLPIIAFSGSETAAPVTDAGVLLVPCQQPAQLHEALVRVLSDVTLRADLASRSRTAYQLHFSWSSIADRYSALFKN